MKSSKLIRAVTVTAVILIAAVTLFAGYALLASEKQKRAEEEAAAAMAESIAESEAEAARSQEEAAESPEKEVIEEESSEEEVVIVYAETPSFFETASFNEVLFERNAAAWAIQNNVRNEDGTAVKMTAAELGALVEKIKTRPATSSIPLVLPWGNAESAAEPVNGAEETEDSGRESGTAGSAASTGEADANAAGEESTDLTFEDLVETATEIATDPESMELTDPSAEEEEAGADARGYFSKMTLRELYQAAYQIAYPETEGYAIYDETLLAWTNAYDLNPAGASLDAPISETEVLRALYFVDGGRAELEEGLMHMFYFYQGIGFFDGTVWRHIDWPSTTFDINGHTMAEAGCGFFSTAMALSYLSEKVVAPVDFKENGEYSGNGAKHTVGENTALSYDIPAHRTKDFEEVKEALREGYPVMVLETGPSMWADYGHFILLGGITEDDRIVVYNPGGDPHLMYLASDYGYYTVTEITDFASKDGAYTIFGK